MTDRGQENHEQPAAVSGRPESAAGLYLLVIAKEPVPGRVKTRLTPPYSPAEAARLAAAALADTLDAVAAASRTLRARPMVVLDGQPGPWLPPEFTVVGQTDGPFDVRLAAAFDAVHGQPALLIGMDTPQLDQDDLVAAARRMRAGSDAVLGRALDGGWWALGLRSSDGSLVRGVRTSTAETGAHQRARLRAAGLRVGELAVLRDVDTVADVAPVAALAPGSRFAAVVDDLRPRLAVPVGAAGEWG
ncbi:TIGR04282 family arsenosugar biosynthesis glycosyltransferase [Parafrankia discariae]|uniref:TIGR04282 family arsenosugar biosynthesis glycosyltransferase n=1 Tax=Parafrankia discariae TaxID=365528 RepID=UPI00037955E1|nr:DUF2064 domain-containing protein [Parafrankia discariae]